MFQRILVGLDGSPSGRLAFQAALELACWYRAKLIALSIVEEPVTGNDDYDETDSFNYYRQIQGHAVAQASAAGLKLQTLIRHGHAAPSWSYAHLDAHAGCGTSWSVTH